MTTASTVGEKDAVGIGEASVAISHFVKRAHSLLGSRKINSRLRIYRRLDRD